MLASLLPGIRDVRAPLAAGFVWLVAFWFFLEPTWNPSTGAEGLAGSANRLMNTLNILGQGAVLSFAAYLVGSFSVLLASRLLWSLFPATIEPRFRRLEGLSQLARTSLTQVALDGRKRLETALALSGVNVDEVLKIAAPVAGSTGKMAPRQGRVTRRGRDSLSAGTVLPTVEEWQEREIAIRVLRDLPVVATAQLLGNEPDVFSAVDRSKAEVEFRVALVPAFLALSASIAAAAGNAAVAAVSLVVGVLGAGGLILDAARQYREFNELVLSLMEHGRITPPSVLRAESAAVNLADQGFAKVVQRQAEATTRAIRQYVGTLEAVPSSGSYPMPEQAFKASEKARSEAQRLDKLLNRDSAPDDVRNAEDVLDPLDTVLSGWTAINHGLFEERQLPSAIRDPKSIWPDGTPPVDELLRLVDEGRTRSKELTATVRNKVNELTAKETVHPPAAEARDAKIT